MLPGKGTTAAEPKQAAVLARRGGERMTITPETTRQGTQPVDFINASSLLSDGEKEIRDRVRAFVDREVISTSAGYWDKAEFPFDLLPSLAETGISGGSFGEEYGCAGWSNVAYGLAIAELARGSGSLATFLHVQSGLAMAAIYNLGSEEQKQKWLPPMAK
jgi:glutaryl-CoA dehydrogenase